MSLLKKWGISAKMEAFAKTRVRITNMNVSVLLLGKGNTVKYAPMHHPWYAIPIALTNFHSITSHVNENTIYIGRNSLTPRKNKN